MYRHVGSYSQLIDVNFPVLPEKGYDGIDVFGIIKERQTGFRRRFLWRAADIPA
ncbi:hypothetical protein Barb4_02054 [Bacteroidales bacterium Barb4]|nr:hypothetical protein Barb4_02054 [Bacteroidales bacterium Barb4]